MSHNPGAPGDASGLVLDLDEHRYYYGGRPVPGVSEILTGVGIVDARWFKEHHAQRGTAVHRAMELLVQGRLDWASLDERIVGYVRSGELFLKDHGVVIGDPLSLTEHLVYSRAHNYAGKVDAVLRLFGKGPAVVDWKSGSKGHAQLQTAGYADAMKDELGVLAMPRLAVELNEAGKRPKVTEFNDASDFDDFAAAARIYNKYLMTKRRKDDQ